MVLLQPAAHVRPPCHFVEAPSGGVWVPRPLLRIMLKLRGSTALRIPLPLQTVSLLSLSPAMCVLEQSPKWATLAPGTLEGAAKRQWQVGPHSIAGRMYDWHVAEGAPTVAPLCRWGCTDPGFNEVQQPESDRPALLLGTWPWKSASHTIGRCVSRAGPER